MNTKHVLLPLTALCLAGLTTGARAQAANPAPAPAQEQPAAAAAPSTMVYVPQLPSVAELTKVAAAQGMTVERIEQTASQITATYKLPSGQSMVVVYQPLPAEEGGAAPSAPVAYERPAPVYGPAYYPGYYYPDYYGPYWPWYFPPVALRFGFGWGYHHR